MKAIAIDLDGTALTHGGVFSSHLNDVLNKLHDRGLKIIIATGRSMKSLGTKIPDTLKVDGYVAASGVRVQTPEAILESHVFSEDTAHYILNLARKHKMYYEINTETDGPFTFKQDREYILKDLLSDPGESVYGYELIGIERTLKSKKQWVEHVDMAKTIKFYFFSMDAEKISNFYNVLDKNKDEKYALYQTAPHNSETMVSGVDKGTGLETLLDHLGISFDDLHVFGDSMNDTPMFLRAGKKTAMKNATDELKSIADDVTQFSCDDDGLAKYLENHYLK
ncbi:Cof-type HAD-IIB family hydrolase [Phocicoccus pinnipedialis]|uniref:Phosphatase YwpJ n=1 Tax=Phocicoccus pinnipedialis TaxID=110845 RepID=A0A6V7R4U4_9BACL|nr:Cof-type HAD-IIB family hydrolase [Jeotgalicoccus pinnipedialis]MBP1939969.1 Cof subfamily protein (haloacid dehalogenase superfamily) [Jeotgalicoccus pinnipedialis]CAD2072083.1 Putative phosphatase YwpJ [Jeotgalicoccus pinnipedialis]